MSKFENLTAASIPGAREIRVVNLSDEEIVLRAREAFVFAHPAAPLFVRKLARSGRLDWFLSSARQAMRDIEKPVDLLSHESRAAWVLNTHAGLMHSLTKDQKEAVAQLAVTAIRVGTKDFAMAPHAIIQNRGGLGPVILGVLSICAAIAACVVAF